MLGRYAYIVIRAKGGLKGCGMEAAARNPLREGLMKIWQIVVPGLLGLALAGCRSDPEIAYLQRDNLNKQRKIERLQNRVEDLEEALNAAAPAQPGITRGVPPGEMPPEPGTMDGGRSGPASTRPAPPSTPPARPTPSPRLLPGRPHISPGMEVPRARSPSG